ncbi:MAG: hypothetical protein OEZ02_02575 [Anaerolineae bacterium]|nr:hypothetical protein [Anaerolineae bacterium]
MTRRMFAAGWGDGNGLVAGGSDGSCWADLYIGDEGIDLQAQLAGCRGEVWTDVIEAGEDILLRFAGDVRLGHEG